jgi:DNA excision repair protein ERCC-4
MCKSWKTPILLIEFDAKRSFAMQARDQIGSEIQAQSVISKLVLLTLHFPALRLIWSRNPHTTVEIFMQLKQDLPEPDADVLAAEQQALELSTASRDFLRRLPGITDDNIRHVMDNVGSLRELASMSLAKLKELLGARSGQRLFTFLNSISDDMVLSFEV